MLPLNAARKYFFGILLFVSFQSAATFAQQSAPPSSSSMPRREAAPDISVSKETSKAQSRVSSAGDTELQGYAARDSKAHRLDSPPPEDFSLLRVPAGIKFNVLPLEKGDFPEYTTELVRAEWRAWDPIDLWIIKPAEVKNPPVILYLYSYPSTNRRYASPEFCKFLTKNGFAAVGFVSALTGERFVARPLKEWFVSELQESLATSVHDVQFILNYLDQRGDMDMTRVGMFGDGSGASIAVMAAAVDPRIKVLDLMDPWGDWPDWLAKSTLVPEEERPAYLKPDFLKQVENLDPVKWLPILKTQQVRIQHIEDIKVTPLVVRERLEAAAPPYANIVRYDNTKAFMANVAATGKGFDWIKEHVGSLPPAISEATMKTAPRVGSTE